MLTAYVIQIFFGLCLKGKGYLKVVIPPVVFDVQDHSMASHEGYKPNVRLLCKCQNQVEIKERSKQWRWKASRYVRTPSFVSLSSQRHTLHPMY